MWNIWIHPQEKRFSSKKGVKTRRLENRKHIQHNKWASFEYYHPYRKAGWNTLPKPDPGVNPGGRTSIPESQLWQCHHKPCTPQASCSQNCKSKSRCASSGLGIFYLHLCRRRTCKLSKRFPWAFSGKTYHLSPVLKSRRQLLSSWKGCSHAVTASRLCALLAWRTVIFQAGNQSLYAVSSIVLHKGQDFSLVTVGLLEWLGQSAHFYYLWFSSYLVCAN